MPGCAHCAVTNRTISKCRNLARANVDQCRLMVRADFPSLQLHSFPMTKTTRDKCKTIERCRRDLSCYSYMRSECSGLPGCWSGQTLKAGHVSHYGGGGEVERWGGEKKKKRWMNFPASWSAAHVESHFVMINRDMLSVSLSLSVHRRPHGQWLRLHTPLRCVCWTYV